MSLTLSLNTATSKLRERAPSHDPAEEALAQRQAKRPSTAVQDVAV